MTLQIRSIFTLKLLLTWSALVLEIRKGIKLYFCSETSDSHGGEYEVAVFWVVATCSLVEVYGHFRGACCLHL
jgi:hypothetical protein